MRKMCKGEKQGRKRATVSSSVAVPDTGCQKRDKERCTWKNYWNFTLEDCQTGRHIKRYIFFCFYLCNRVVTQLENALSKR